LYKTQAFLEEQGASASLIERVLSIIASVGFKDSLGGQQQAALPIEAAIVQDADRCVYVFVRVCVRICVRKRADRN